MEPSAASVDHTEGKGEEAVVIPPEKPIFAWPNVVNSCYIDTVLMALFYNNTPVSKYLDFDLKNDTLSEIQDYIKIMIGLARDNASIDPDMMQYFRNQLFEAGWCFGDMEEFYEQQDVKELYTFLLDKLGIPTIKCRRVTFAEGLDSSSDWGGIEEIPYIPLSIPSREERPEGIDTKTLVDTWMNNNPSVVNREIMEGGVKKVEKVNALNTYYIDNVPPVIALSVGRFPDHLTRLDTDIFVKMKMMPFKNQKLPDAERSVTWNISSIICHRQEIVLKDPPPGYSPLKSGHYYALLVNQETKKCHIFDDQKPSEKDPDTPSLVEVSMGDPEIVGAIKREAVFILYTGTMS